MGCWDIFCFICGNPCHSILDGYIENIEEILNEKNNYKLKKRFENSPNIVNDLKKLYKETKWMNKCSMLLFNDKVVHGLKETSCNVDFTKKNFLSTHYVYALGDLGGDKSGIFIHTDCWKFIKKNYNIELKASYLPKLKSKNYNKNFDIDYGKIEKYWFQYFNFEDIVIDKNAYLCYSPLLNDKNISQIKKNITALKLRNDPKRLGPLVSATFYNDGDIRIGNDKYFWIKKSNKWIKINEKPVIFTFSYNNNTISNTHKNFIYKLKQIGLENTQPIFILSNIIQKNIVKIKLLVSESYKEILIKKYKFRH